MGPPFPILQLFEAYLESHGHIRKTVEDIINPFDSPV
jgi:hypothetical protein